MRLNKIRIVKYLLIIVLITLILNVAYQYLLNSADSNLKDWHDYLQMKDERERSGPGEKGTAVTVGKGEKDEDERLFKITGYRALVSDKISLFRYLPDIRHPACKKKLYLKDLPTVSIIIPFYEEHLSTLMRTFIGAMHRAPKHLIKEVILVDDGSLKPFLKSSLDTHLATIYPRGNVRVFHHPKRVGLVQARITGAKNATGDVLFFMDAHCEVNVNWLPPLLDPIARDYKTVTCPFIDVIDAHNFEYRAQDEGARGSFNWEFLYKRLPRLSSDSSHPADPFDSPIMAGGLFAISRKWFEELGGYDPELMIWGGEQYELSFKIWMCGGRMIDVPCSRIGHIYRALSVFPNPNIGDFIAKNYRRVAEVWMDDYKKYIYARRPHYESVDTGDISARKALRANKCSKRDFKWFLTNVAFDLLDKYPLVEPTPGAKGQIKPVSDDTKCLDVNNVADMSPVNVAPCLKDSPTQNFELSWHDDIRIANGLFCLDVPRAKDGGVDVILYICHYQQGNQAWRLEPLASKDLVDLKLSNTATTPVQLRLINGPNLCMDLVNIAQIKGTGAKSDKSTKVTMRTCDSKRVSQIWTFDNMNLVAFEAAKKKAAMEH